ncbi:histidine kinase [Winogradskyella sp. PE311]|uniref:tetratricopeptide repeat-containing sensor histidine kinase n=1 Tax=Winogradskyella sp. PE311 TaxID=3366943 RepID=UPI00398090DC
MKTLHKFILTLFLIAAGAISHAQNNAPEKTPILTIRGSVYDEQTYSPISKVSVQINGSKYTTTDVDGKFTIQARVGDELMVTHDSFDPIYYTIKGDDRLYFQVESDEYPTNKRQRINNEKKAFNRLIDSADFYIKKDATKSIKFIGDALNVNVSVGQSAEAHELLGDVYTYWKQFDLAISAYKISLQNSEKSSAKLKLAKSYLMNDDSQKSINTYNELDIDNLSNYEKVILYEGLGDAYLNRKNYQQATKSYNLGLDVAKEHFITPKITDLNSKIAQTYNAQGRKKKAKGYFDNSLELASKENKTRAVEEKAKVAEFNSNNEDYENEIVLRKQIINDIKDIERDSVISNESPLTAQKQNYKIANALVLQNRNNDAIPFYEKSIEEAEKTGDLVVKRDATRNLSSALIETGDTKKGYAVLEEHIRVVDELYAQKVQETSQVARFSRKLAEQQNRITSLESDRILSRTNLELAQERYKSQQVTIYSLIGGLVLLLITGLLIYKYIKQQRLSNNLLALKSLRSQMNPHFIFNALNSVNSFIATNDERTANKYLSDFSNLMRSVLENSEEDFIPLQKEIELLELYTKLEHFRFQDKFDYAITVDENLDLEDFQIPPMLLQPYIENAVWHGLRYKSEKGQLNITIKPKSKDTITITVTDDGIGRERSKALKTANQKKQNSKGMSNIKERVAILNKMYKDKVDIKIEDYQDIEDTGTKVEVTLKKD